MIKIRNLKQLAQTGDVDFTVPTDKSWMVKFAALRIDSTGTSGPVRLEVDGVKVYETPNIGTVLDESQILVGGEPKGTEEAMPKQIFLTSAQVLRFDNAQTYDLDVHISVVERDIPT